ncbi:MAG TPA: hypothetical protein VHZ24_18920 [Pirellulales bacterium]|jgi:hypothetical protein|nr:hypothetical protein [Pirellulales bacterium]
MATLPRFTWLLVLACCTALPAAEPVSTQPVRTTALVIKQGGTPEKPAVFDGQGMVIDLAIDVTDHAWRKTGDVWTSDGPLLGRTPIVTGQLAGLFLEELPLSIPRDAALAKQHPEHDQQRCYVAPAELKTGQMGYADDGSLYFRWPAHKDPAKTCILLPPKEGTSCIAIVCSHVIVRNITAIHAANDGFNIHGKWVGIRLENVKAFSNADEGISAHDDVEMQVDGAEIAFNGSSAGGVADVDHSVTTYRHCMVHDNLAAAFKFGPARHVVADTLIYNQSRDFSLDKNTQLETARVEWRRE